MDTETLKLALVLVMAIVVLVGAGLLRVYGKWARRNPGSYETNKLTRTGIAVYGLFAVALFVGVFVGVLGDAFLEEEWMRSELWFYAYIAVISAVLVVAALVLAARGFPLTKDKSSGDVFGERGAVRHLPHIQQRIDLRHAGHAGGARPLPARPSLETLDPTLDPESETSDSLTKSFERLGLVAIVVYFAGLIAFYVYSSGDWNMPRLFPLSVFAPFFVLFGLHAIYTGKVWVRGQTRYRSKNPVAYWGFVATLLTIGIVLFLADIGVIGT